MKVSRRDLAWLVPALAAGSAIRRAEAQAPAAGRAAGMVDVKVAGFSATHSALKFVIPKAQR